MKKYKNKLLQFIKSRTLTHEIFGVLLIITGYANKYMAGINAMYKGYSRLNRKYKKEIGKKTFAKYDDADNSRIWFCWLQGIDSAPDLVKSCLSSIKYHCKEAEVVILDKNNFKDYCSLPDYIVEKWEKGIIPNAHFSDILRLQLLIEHGGIWMDSTVYLTSSLPDYITNSDLFFYQNGWFNNEMINLGSWLMKSNPNNILLQETQNLLFLYWKRHNYLCQYFLAHIFFRMVSDYYSEEFSKIPYYNQIDTHILQMEMYKSFDEKRFAQIKDISSVHKLTNKTEEMAFDTNSYYSKLGELYK